MQTNSLKESLRKTGRMQSPLAEGMRLEAQDGVSVSPSTQVGPWPEVKEAPLGHRGRKTRRLAESEPCREARPHDLLGQWNQILRDEGSSVSSVPTGL